MHITSWTKDSRRWLGRLTLAAIAGTAGCSARVHIDAADDSKLVREGITYYLPSSRYRIRVTYSLVETWGWVVTKKSDWDSFPEPRPEVKTDDYGMPVITDARGKVVRKAKVKVGDEEEDAYVIDAANMHVLRLQQKDPIVRRLLIKDKIEFAPSAVADPALAFTLDNKALESVGVTVSNGKLTLSGEGIIKAVNADFDDRSAEIIGSVIKTGIAVAKIAAIMPTLNAAKDEAYRYAAAEPHLGDADARGFEEFLLGTEEYLKQYLVYITDEKTIATRTIERYVSLADFALSQSKGDSEDPSFTRSLRVFPTDAELADIRAKTPFPDENISNATFSLTSHRELGGTITAREILDQLPKARRGGLDGIVFRTVAPVALTHKVDDELVWAGTLSVPEAGGFGWIPLKSHMFSRRTGGLTFSESTGGVTEYTFSSTSPAERAASLLQSTAESVPQTITDLETIGIDREIKRLTKEKELLDARRALEKARKDDDESP